MTKNDAFMYLFNKHIHALLLVRLIAFVCFS